MMTLAEIDEAEARAKAATEGPWHWTQTDDKEPSLLLAEQRGWTCHSAEENSNLAEYGRGSRGTECTGQQGKIFFGWNDPKNANVDEIRWDGRTRAFPTPPGWIEFTDRLERAVELGGLSDLDAEAIAVAGAYTKLKPAETGKSHCKRQ